MSFPLITLIISMAASMLFAAISVSDEKVLLPIISKFCKPTDTLGKCLKKEMSTSLKSTLAFIFLLTSDFTNATICFLNK